MPALMLALVVALPVMVQFGVPGVSAVHALAAVQVAASGSHTCAVLSSGNVDCWGYNGNGRAADYEAHPPPKTRNNADGSVTVYDDQNGNGQVDDGEEIATLPPAPAPPNP